MIFSSRADILIQGWMIDLGLKNEELLIYAYIFSYTWKAEASHWPDLTVELISAKLNMSRTVVINRIPKLIEKGLITGTLKAVNIHE